MRALEQQRLQVDLNPELLPLAASSLWRQCKLRASVCGRLACPSENGWIGSVLSRHGPSAGLLKNVSSQAHPREIQAL